MANVKLTFQFVTTIPLLANGIRDATHAGVKYKDFLFMSTRIRSPFGCMAIQ